MKQVVMRGGKLQVVEVPGPAATAGSLLVANAASAISSGTERSVVESGSGSLAARAIRNPALVRQTLAHARARGVRETVELVRGAAEADSPLGYSSAGTVLDTGGLAEFHVGQRVACAGAGRANHAELVSVPGNLACAVPEGTSLRDAAFAAIGAISLQGARRAEPRLGERVVVVGLGLLGLLTTQILRAAGCRVAAVEPVERRRALGGMLGAELVFAPSAASSAVTEWSAGAGADAVVVTASGKDDAIVNDAVRMVRRKGRVVPVGEIGLGLERGPLYEREADILISTSYGPGRYDPSYEEAGVDYPLPYVRWTAARNMEEFLRLVAGGAVRLDPLIELELPVERADEAYAALADESPPLAAVLAYPEQAREPRPLARAAPRAAAAVDSEVGIALVGAGSFVRSTLVPNLRRLPGARVTSVVSRGGSSAAALARSIDGARPCGSWQEAVEDPDVDLILVATRHDTHAEIAAAALRAGKAVFLEKPLGLTREQIDDVWEAGGENARLAIGFNRPFAELSEPLGDEVRAASGPTQLLYRVSAPVPADHWLNDPLQGGGRILGEACHMFDFSNWLCGTPERVFAAALPAPPGVASPESATVTVQFADGSTATVNYSGVSSAAMPKERVEVMRGGRSWLLDDFRTLTSYGPEGEKTRRSNGDKGHAGVLGRAISACRGEAPFEPGLSAAYLAQSVALAALESISSGRTVEVAPPPARAD
ncbi:MAG TPA: bi-domain-containing oxidoreductase [Gaiellaceae bacterium]|jgi:polar amino acid transport system substrate-binding protein|nr:bi-domain-containing oxidoreductase [Gaiellaceae bacterium]